MKQEQGTVRAPEASEVEKKARCEECVWYMRGLEEQAALEVGWAETKLGFQLHI